VFEREGKVNSGSEIGKGGVKNMEQMVKQKKDELKKKIKHERVSLSKKRKMKKTSKARKNRQKNGKWNYVQYQLYWFIGLLIKQKI